MQERDLDLPNQLRYALDPAFRNRLADRGIARGLIWENGVLPDGSPAFSDNLTEDLMDYAYGIMWLAMRMMSTGQDRDLANQALRAAGESIQSAVHNGDRNRIDLGFHRVNAALAFHLAGYPTLAYSMLPSNPGLRNLSPTEDVLVRLFRRRLSDMRNSLMTWLRNSSNLDHGVADQLSRDSDFEADDAAHILITTSFMRAIASFDHAIRSGESRFADSAKEALLTAAATAHELNFVTHWWTNTLAAQLIDDLWSLSLHETIPTLPPDQSDHGAWNQLRENFIQRSINDDPPTIALWPSQIDAARRATDQLDNLVVALPTSAGKTLIAQLCILRAMAANRRVIYVTPLRALSAQIERDLAGAFLPLGFTVSSLYNAVDIDSGDGETLRQGHIVVCTPEKLSFALRNDPTLIDDVGLVVLDEGHMLGPDEREVRYEILLEGLLKRNDASYRRIAVLSALFPEPEKMEDLVAWVRQDVPGDPVYSNWRPTRSRFGTIRWTGNFARLELEVEGQNSFVPRFVEKRPPPRGPRRKHFPADKNELTLASAWQFIGQGKRVFVFSPTRKSVEKLGTEVLRCIRQGVLEPFEVRSDQLESAINAGNEWLGEGHPAVQCLQHGIALHHAALPRAFLSAVERLLRSGEWPLVIASPTLAQGLNLSASVILVPSIWRAREIIDPREFANVAGRAGRAYVDLEGHIVHVVWPTEASPLRVQLRRWRRLIRQSGAVSAVSGLLELVGRISTTLSDRTQIPLGEVLAYMTSNEDPWNLNFAADDGSNEQRTEWERDLASLDSAIMALLMPETEFGEFETRLAAVLDGTLFKRTLSRQIQLYQDLMPTVIAKRARTIWSGTNEQLRRGIYHSGVGYQTGTYLNTNRSELASLLERAEQAIQDRDELRFARNVVCFAERVFDVAPFIPDRELPDHWREGLEDWLIGRPGSRVIETLGDYGVYAVQDAFTYRLPWAMEAVRVLVEAVGESDSEELTGVAARATGVGSANESVMALLRCGFRSRTGARTAVETTNASFVDRTGMEAWLVSQEVQSRNRDANWPTAQSRHEWEQFYDREANRDSQVWHREQRIIDVNWFETPPPIGSEVLFEESENAFSGTILSPDYRELGTTILTSDRPLSQIVSITVADDPNTLAIHYYGPISRSTP
ncbi:MAG: DEAD/DEAH box helicase [Chloroflexi bacterium]|nr:DEAD/DEAH box helicase [Chloroflexota bacterium]